MQFKDKNNTTWHFYGESDNHKGIRVQSLVNRAGEVREGTLNKAETVIRVHGDKYEVSK